MEADTTTAPTAPPAEASDGEDAHGAGDDGEVDVEDEEEESGLDFVLRARQLQEQKATIADICTAVLEAPEQHIARLKELRRLCGAAPGSAAPSPVALGSTASLLAMVSATTVFRDIIPGYVAAGAVAAGCGCRCSDLVCQPCRCVA